MVRKGGVGGGAWRAAAAAGADDEGSVVGTWGSCASGSWYSGSSNMGTEEMLDKERQAPSLHTARYVYMKTKIRKKCEQTRNYNEGTKVHNPRQQIAIGMKTDKL